MTGDAVNQNPIDKGRPAKQQARKASYNAAA
jgi:hypothetical protein